MRECGANRVPNCMIRPRVPRRPGPHRGLGRRYRFTRSGALTLRARAAVTESGCEVTRRHGHAGGALLRPAPAVERLAESASTSCSYVGSVHPWRIRTTARDFAISPSRRPVGVALGAGVVYGLLILAYSEFYKELGVRPADVGLDYGRGLGGAAGLALLAVVVFVVPAGAYLLVRMLRKRRSSSTSEARGDPATSCRRSHRRCRLAGRDPGARGRVPLEGERLGGRRQEKARR
jgi:hypothetical protein